MGHANIETTMDIYAEATELKKHEAMKALEKNSDIFQERVLDRGYLLNIYTDIKKGVLHQIDIKFLDFGRLYYQRKRERSQGNKAWQTNIDYMILSQIHFPTMKSIDK